MPLSGLEYFQHLAHLSQDILQSHLTTWKDIMSLAKLKRLNMMSLFKGCNTVMFFLILAIRFLVDLTRTFSARQTLNPPYVPYMVKY